MEAALYTLEEASRLTGRSPEALRKRFMRGQIEGVSSRESNDGKVRLRLTEEGLSSLRRVDERTSEEAEGIDSPPSGESTNEVLTRLLDSLDKRLIRTESDLDQARQALEAERVRRSVDRQEREVERTAWVDRLDALNAQYMFEIAALKDARAADQKSAEAMLGRARSTISSLRSAAAGPVPQASRRGILGKIFGSKS